MERATRGGIAAATLLTLMLTGVAFAAAGHAIAGGHYAGKTTQHQATTIVVSGNARTITTLKAAVSYDGLCGKRAAGPAFSITAKNVAITAGSFSVVAPATAAGAKPLTMIVTGSFTGKAVNGTIAERNGHCAKPKTVLNPYLTTFSAKAG